MTEQKQREAFEAWKKSQGDEVLFPFQIWQSAIAWYQGQAAIAQAVPAVPEDELWKVLEAATNELDRRAAPHAWVSIAWDAGYKYITDRRAMLSAAPSAIADRNAIIEECMRVVRNGPLIPTMGEHLYMTDDCKAMAVSLNSQLAALKAEGGKA